MRNPAWHLPLYALFVCLSRPNLPPRLRLRGIPRPGRRSLRPALPEDTLGTTPRKTPSRSLRPAYRVPAPSDSRSPPLPSSWYKVPPARNRRYCVAVLCQGQLHSLALVCGASVSPQLRLTSAIPTQSRRDCGTLGYSETRRFSLDTANWSEFNRLQIFHWSATVRIPRYGVQIPSKRGAVCSRPQWWDELLMSWV